MSTTRDMIRTSPATTGYEAEALAACIEACFACAQTCIACDDACLAEDQVADLRRCITLNRNCADICLATGQALSRQTSYDADVTRALLTACRDICRACAEECERHAGEHDHCRLCAEVCRRCETACDRLLAA